jgi:hypothetical protein
MAKSAWQYIDLERRKRINSYRLAAASMAAWPERNRQPAAKGGLEAKKKETTLT